MKKLHFLILLTISTGFSAILNVPAEFPTIQSAIDTSSNSDTILVEIGTYYENINFNGKNITVTSFYLLYPDPEYIEMTIIDGSEPENFLLTNVVTFMNGEDSTAVLNGFTVQNGYSAYMVTGAGGGIAIQEASPVISNCIIRSNRSLYNIAAPGGGIGCYNSFSTLKNLIITDNEAASDGGGIVLIASDVILKNVIIENNIVEGTGAGLSMFASHPHLQHVVIRNNHSEQSAGGIYISDDSYPVFDDSLRCSIYNNTGKKGRDIYLDDDHESIEIPLDTFTVNAFTEYYAYPIDSVGSDILNPLIHLAGPEVYISQFGNDESSGTSEETPFKTIVHALSRVLANPNTPGYIYLQEGIYSPYWTWEQFPIQLFSYLTISGKGDSLTIIDAEGMDNIFDINRANQVWVENMTLKNGDHNYWFGGAVNIKYSQIITLSNLVISNCTANRGGGLSVQSSINVDLSYLQITENRATNNYFYSMGGAIYCDNDVEMTLDHITSSRNHGGGILVRNGSSVVMRNSIFWGDTLSNGEIEEITFGDVFDPVQLQISYSDIQNGYSGIVNSNEGEIEYGEGMIQSDPQFTASLDGDYSLQETSPCIDTGDPDSGLDQDSTRTDMGALYFDQWIGFSGDLNNDGNVSVSDVVLTVQIILGNLEPSEYQLFVGDLNQNGLIEVSDIILIVQIILND